MSRKTKEEIDNSAKAKEAIADFLTGFMADNRNAEWAKSRRLGYLDQQMKELCYAYVGLSSITHPVVIDLAKQDQEDILKKIGKIKREIDIYAEPESMSLSHELNLEKAREYPIETLLEVNSRGFAKCIWHEDTNPSMYCKNNYAYCFTCGETGDVIKVYMHIKGIGFKQAVKELGK